MAFSEKSSLWNHLVWENSIYSLKVLEKWILLMLGLPGVKVFWAHNARCNLIILSIFDAKWPQNSKNGQIGRFAVSSKPHGFRSTKRRIRSIFQLLSDCIHYFPIQDDSTDSIFQKAPKYFIPRERRRKGMGYTVQGVKAVRDRTIGELPSSRAQGECALGYR